MNVSYVLLFVEIVLIILLWKKILKIFDLMDIKDIAIQKLWKEIDYLENENKELDSMVGKLIKENHKLLKDITKLSPGSKTTTKTTKKK